MVLPLIQQKYTKFKVNTIPTKEKYNGSTSYPTKVYNLKVYTCSVHGDNKAVTTFYIIKA
jgi:hypothetical protein